MHHFSFYYFIFFSCFLFFLFWKKKWSSFVKNIGDSHIVTAQFHAFFFFLWKYFIYTRERDTKWWRRQARTTKKKRQATVNNKRINMTDFFVLFFSVFSSFYCFFGMQFGIIICFTGTSHACHMTLACIQYKVWYGHENSKNNAQKKSTTNSRSIRFLFFGCVAGPGVFIFVFVVVVPHRAIV